MATKSRVSPTALLVFVVLVATLPSASRAYTARAIRSSCSICRYAIIHRLFDACFIHFCYNSAIARSKHSHALMKRALPSDWLEMEEKLAQKKNVPTDWWRPPGLLFWVNQSEKKHNNYS